MPVNRKKLLELLKLQFNDVNDRCTGYKKELLETIAEIIALEQQHRVQGTNIRQKVSDKCSDLGKFLADNHQEDDS